MTGLIIIFCLILIGVIVVQIGKVTELAARIRGEEEAMMASNNRQGVYMMVFLVFFLIFCVACSLYYKDWILWYGPHTSASVHGIELDSLFNTTLFFTGIVFVITHILLFYFAYKYRYQKGRKALYMPHDNTVELIWTIIPAIVMSFLVVRGLAAWNTAMADIGPDEDHIEIEAMGQQFAWLIRYPGADGALGTRNYKKFTATNPFGQEWEDTKNLDDFHPSEIVLPKGKKVRVRITAKDVLHNFDLPHFRVKMDAIPGLPTYFVFTPRLTTKEYRERLKKSPHYQGPSDPEDPESPPMWEAFEFELACAELCGIGHYSMRRVVRIVEEDEYEEWLSQQKSWYDGNVMGTAEDPYGDLSTREEIPAHLAANLAKEFQADAQNALDATDNRTVLLKHVYYTSGSYNFSGITEKYYLNNLVDFMKKNPAVKIQLAGHTDSDGDDGSNQALSENRAGAIADFLSRNGIDGSRFSSIGYGETQPVDTNETAAGKAKNRRTEFTIIAPVAAATTSTETGTPATVGE